MLENFKTLVDDEKLYECNAKREAERCEERVVQQNTDGNARSALRFRHAGNLFYFKERERQKYTIHHEKRAAPRDHDLEILFRHGRVLFHETTRTVHSSTFYNTTTSAPSIFTLVFFFYRYAREN